MSLNSNFYLIPVQLKWNGSVSYHESNSGFNVVHPFQRLFQYKYIENNQNANLKGFNGQEKDNEVGEGIYTAEFWEYDSRIGRRWNLDPVVKPWQSSYSCFSNSPISRIDPLGDDDYFDNKGVFLYRTKSGNNIMIKTNSKDLLLSQAVLSTSALRGIGQYYAKSVKGMKGNENIWGQQHMGAVMHVSAYGGFGEYKAIMISQETDIESNPGHTSDLIDNYNDFKNCLAHEWWHYEKQYTKTKSGSNVYTGPSSESIRELDAYDYQINHDTWSSISAKYRANTIRNIGSYINKIEDKKIRAEKIKYFETKLKVKFSVLSDKAINVKYEIQN